MPWTTSDRRTQLPANWPALRAQTKRRAGGHCERIKADGTRCRAWGNQCDHVDPNGPDELHNLEWLCQPHHAAKSSAEGHAAMRALRAKAKHPTERHPGLR